MNCKELNVFKMDNEYPSGIKGIFERIKTFPTRIKWAYQRATKGFCDADVYSLDFFYTNLFRESIRELAKVSIGYPARLDDGCGRTEEENLKLWKDKLINISNHFSFEPDYTIEDDKKNMIEIRKGIREINKYFFDLWW